MLNYWLLCTLAEVVSVSREVSNLCPGQILRRWEWEGIVGGKGGREARGVGGMRVEKEGGRVAISQL